MAVYRKRLQGGPLRLMWNRKQAKKEGKVLLLGGAQPARCQPKNVSRHSRG